MPTGFDNLLKRVLREDPAFSRELPDNLDDIWANFTWAIFLDANRSDAEVNYLYDVFTGYRLLSLRTIRTLVLEWSERIREACNREIRRVSGRKEALLKAMMYEPLLQKATNCMLSLLDISTRSHPKALERGHLRLMRLMNWLPKSHILTVHHISTISD